MVIRCFWSTVKKNLKIMLLALTIPIALFGVGYTYAQQFTTDYVRLNIVPMKVSQATVASVSCDPGDLPTGGEYQIHEKGAVAKVGKANVFTVYGSPLGASNTLTVVAFDHRQRDTLILEVYLHCISPITVAGISVPEFGSIYSVIILTTAFYTILTRMQKLHLIPAK